MIFSDMRHPFCELTYLFIFYLIVNILLYSTHVIQTNQRKAGNLQISVRLKRDGVSRRVPEDAIPIDPTVPVGSREALSAGNLQKTIRRVPGGATP
ncbi:hypothetical protein ACFL6K_05065 [Candidatus Latescibacterota bacterium]